MKRVFISRNLKEGSVFLKRLVANGFEVHGASLIELSPVEFGEFPPVDWLFFYSKNAVGFFLKLVSKNKIKGIKLAAMGAATAELLATQFKTADFIGDGIPESTASAFVKVASGQRVLFPHAKNSRQSIQKLLGGQIVAFDRVVYENNPRTTIDLPDVDCLVFTSPMNAEAYFFTKEWKDFQKVVAIGQTTAKTLKRLKIKAFTVAKTPSEEGLAEAVLSCF